jgi:hypothetical protein
VAIPRTGVAANETETEYIAAVVPSTDARASE